MYKMILVLLGCVFFACSSACPEAKTAQVFSVTGDAKVIPVGSNIGIACRKGMEIHPADWIKTGAGSSVTLSFDEKGDNAMTVSENSIIIMKMDGYFKIQLLQGKVLAILENVEHGETFRALTPSVVAESTSSKWAVSSEGVSSTVVVVDGEAFVCGINKDGSVKKERYNIREGYARTTNAYEEPGELTKTPENVMSWFKGQVVEHHLSKVIAEKVNTEETTPEGSAPQEQPFPVKTETPPETAGTKGRNIAVIDGKEVDILEYLYKNRLTREQKTQ
ncbi:MAG: FecR domain-containing protein [Candidatus Omnitrophica bacterium]|nr:FecR domain-containing protein [Candidatus Omnitrophota bacterium]